VVRAEVARQADELATASAYYAKAFRVAARICRSRFPETAAGQTLSRIFEEKARLEDDLGARLAADPGGTLREEGLI
jgi:hypothetical protein